ncbi:hypothetical protein LTR08_008028 [Meristemomyces frigidus]|nr:hypothetical protein LTR08_008028 [Meristemomyces frigidus]
MHLSHGASTTLHHLRRRYPFLRQFTVTTSILTLLWIYVLYWGERSIFTSGIEACAWDKWEQWPREAAPHHLILVADPQLVDPHTYPGRPWPLSSLTEIYTDMYMARNFRLINKDLDPDSIVFLGDLLDGGREWATDRARPLKQSQVSKLEAMGVIGGGRPTWKRDAGGISEGSETGGSGDTIDKASQKQDLKDFVYGENGRWSKWDQRQWATDFARFGRIFFDSDQLYPQSERRAFPAYEVPSDPVSVLNGADNVTWQEYAVAGGKSRRIITSLPGNHDVGFGMGVQMAVKDRHHLHFGEGNRIDIIGNHTFISLDTPSLSAVSQFMPGGGETPNDKSLELKHIWKPPMHFLENLRRPTGKAVADALHEYYPDDHPRPGHLHTVLDPSDVSNPPATVSAVDLKAQLPVILLTHVPLYRDPDTDCGRLHERGHAISVSAGYQYQNVVTRSLSNTIANRVSAAGELIHVFSGDDHDYCDVTHRYNLGQTNTAAHDGGKSTSVLRSVKEITVKSFSWAMGVRRPGFLLVSLWNPVDAAGATVGTPLPTIQTHLCLLPDQLATFINYAILVGFSLMALLVRGIYMGVRAKDVAEEDEAAETPPRLVLPRFPSKANGAADGFSTPIRESKSRQRTSSVSTSMNHTSNSNSSLGVQRNYTARTRSVSPANGLYTPSGQNSLDGYNSPGGERTHALLIEKAGYYPQVRWTDPADDSDDEKSVGGDGIGEEDSQAKWKKKPRTPGKAWKVLKAFLAGVLLVGVPVGFFYGWLLKNG